jgi:hypothetical protein
MRFSRGYLVRTAATRLAILPLLGALALHAQPSPGKSTRAGVDRGEIQAVIGMARVAPPEFGADALITLVESGMIGDHRAQRDLLEEAFDMAGNAQERIALRRGSGDSPITSALHGAFRNGVDQASLRSRAALALLRIDSAAARDMFQRIELPIQPNPNASGCEQQVVPDLTLYYVAMWEVARGIPERAHLEGFLRSHLARLRSTAQITPLARVLMQVPDLERMPALIDAFALRLPDLDRDPRVFSTYYEQSIEAIGQLVSSVAPGSRERLIQESRAWAIRNIDQGLCAEPLRYSVSFDGEGRRAIENTLPEGIFNQFVARWSHTTGADILASDLIPHEPGPPAALRPNSSDYTEHFRTHLLLSRDDDTALDLARWRGEMEDYIARLTSWNLSAPAPVPDAAVLNPAGPNSAAFSAAPNPGASNANAIDPLSFYLEKSDLLSQILFIEKHAPAAPGGRVMITAIGTRRQTGPRVEIPGRDRVMAALVDWFDGETARQVFTARRLVWFSPVRDLLGTYEDSDRTLGMAELYARSQNAVLGMYGRLAKLVATPQ